jgi:hypothetical protein
VFGVVEDARPWLRPYFAMPQSERG